MSSASVRFGTKAYVCARYFLRPGKCFKYIDQRGEDVTEHCPECFQGIPCDWSLNEEGEINEVEKGNIN